MQIYQPAQQLGANIQLIQNHQILESGRSGLPSHEHDVTTQMAKTFNNTHNQY